MLATSCRTLKAICVICCLLIAAGCTTYVSPPLESRQERTGQSFATVVPSFVLPSSIPATQGHVYACQKRVYDTQLEARFGIRSSQVRVISDRQVEIATWGVRSVRNAIEQDLPIPMMPPDGYNSDDLPTDYGVYHYDLITNVFTPTIQEISPFRDDYCNGFCEQQVLSNSPDNQWQLVVVSSAWGDSYRGIWLVHRGYYERLIAPFNIYVEYYRTSEAWWRWQADSSGLFLTYRTAGERPSHPMYIQLSTPPAYVFLWEGVHLGPSLVSYHTFPVDEQTILLKVVGLNIQDDGEVLPKQWYIFGDCSACLAFYHELHEFDE